MASSGATTWGPQITLNGWTIKNGTCAVTGTFTDTGAQFGSPMSYGASSYEFITHVDRARWHQLGIPDPAPSDESDLHAARPQRHRALPCPPLPGELPERPERDQVLHVVTHGRRGQHGQDANHGVGREPHGVLVHPHEDAQGVRHIQRRVDRHRGGGSAFVDSSPAPLEMHGDRSDAGGTACFHGRAIDGELGAASRARRRRARSGPAASRNPASGVVAHARGRVGAVVHPFSLLVGEVGASRYRRRCSGRRLTS